ncbi:MAG: LysM peptidoglycan-binding domain-containing protein [Elusimicrobiota bacterium]
MTLMLLLLGSRPALAAYDDLGAAARAIGMGNAFVAIADDGQAGYYNPAGLASLPRPELVSSYGRLYMGLDDGSSLAAGYAAYAHPLGNERGGLAVSWSNMSLSGAYQEDMFRLSYGRDLSESWSAGMSLKWLMLKIGQDEYTARDPVFDYGGKDSVSSVSMDMGTQLRLGENYRLGLALTDLNRPNIGFSVQERVPLGFKLGAARVGKLLNLASDVSYRDRDLKVFTGVERLLADRFCVRGGLGIGTRQFANISVGFGLVERFFRVDYAFLYPVSGPSATAGSHRLGLSIPFGKAPERVDRIDMMIMPSGEVVEELTPPPPPPPKPVIIRKQAPAPSGPIRHIVKHGDNLKSLAAQYYGRPEKWVEIYEVNRYSIGPEGELTVGQVLIIPEGGR